MSIRREAHVEARLRDLIRDHAGPVDGVVGNLDDSLVPGAELSCRTALALFESCLQSRLQDLESRRLKDKGETFYTIGSSGHEANSVFGHLLRPTDPALLHYRSGAFLAARARLGRGETPVFDAMLSFTASAEDPISGGRHKVLGSHSLMVPPQTSTIASHLPKAVGQAYALARLERLQLQGTVPLHDSVVYCSFGDASANHATAQAGFCAASAADLHRQPCPVLFVCEDNGIGISVRTPNDYIERCFANRPGLRYFAADGHDFVDTYAQALRAIEWCREHRRPVFFHLRTERLMGHAGSDVETNYRTSQEIEAAETRDPLLGFADRLMSQGAIDPEDLWDLYLDMVERIDRAGSEAKTRAKLTSRAQVTTPLQLPDADELSPRVATDTERQRIFDGRLPEDEPRPRHFAYRMAQGLRDLLAAYPNAFVFGEDVARKGGVYHVTDNLHRTFGSGRVFNTILDETTILGLAQGMAMTGCLPIPEIQYLAYIHNALDQIRGEAASLQFFSNSQFANPMVVRVAAYAYQKGFGGHFHNDNSIGALLDIPGLIIATPSRGDEAVSMLRTCAAAAEQHGKVCIFLEPIALYMQKDLHAEGDGLWQFAYPTPDECTPLGRARCYEAKDDDQLTILSYGNGLHMSLRAQKILAQRNINARVVDLRWLAPLPMQDIGEQAKATGRLLIVDECRHTGGGPSAHIMAELQDEDLVMRRITGVDSYIPLGAAANLLLVQVDDIIEAAEQLAAQPLRSTTTGELHA